MCWERSRAVAHDHTDGHDALRTQEDERPDDVVDPFQGARDSPPEVGSHAEEVYHADRADPPRRGGALCVLGLKHVPPPARVHNVKRRCAVVACRVLVYRTLRWSHVPENMGFPFISSWVLSWPSPISLIHFTVDRLLSQVVAHQGRLFSPLGERGCNSKPM